MIQYYNQWVCIKSHYVVFINENDPYIEGQVYLFHEDNPQDEELFKLIVDENDFPVKVRVREND